MPRRNSQRWPREPNETASGKPGAVQSIANDCYALAMKINHYNDAHATEEPLLSLFDFTDDVEKMKIAAGLDDAA